MSAPLYNRAILALAVENALYPSLEGARLTGLQRSAVCGSSVELDLVLNCQAQIAKLGMTVTACALGQASATLFARHAIGLDHAIARHARDQLLAWLGGEDDAPHWPDFEILAAVKDYPARHSAIMLPFNVAVTILDGAAC